MGLVYKAISKLAQATPAITAFSVKTIGHATAGATRMLASTAYDAGKLTTKAFERRPGTYLEGLAKGQFIPLRLKKPVAYAAVGGMMAYGAGQGYIEANQPLTQKELQDPNVPYVNIPGTLDKTRSPIDNMGADGSLVFGLHNMR